MKHFYTHIVDLDDVHKELDILEISDDEKNHLILMIESSMNHAVIEALLTELEGDHKHSFLMHISNDDHDNIWKTLKEGHKDPEKRIMEAVQELKDEFLSDIKNAKEEQ